MKVKNISDLENLTYTLFLLPFCIFNLLFGKGLELSQIVILGIIFCLFRLKRTKYRLHITDLKPLMILTAVLYVHSLLFTIRMLCSHTSVFTIIMHINISISMFIYDRIFNSRVKVYYFTNKKGECINETLYKRTKRYFGESGLVELKLFKKMLNIYKVDYITETNEFGRDEKIKIREQVIDKPSELKELLDIFRIESLKLEDNDTLVKVDYTTIPKEDKTLEILKSLNIAYQEVTDRPVILILEQIISKKIYNELCEYDIMLEIKERNIFESISYKLLRSDYPNSISNKRLLHEMGINFTEVGTLLIVEEQTISKFNYEEAKKEGLNLKIETDDESETRMFN